MWSSDSSSTALNATESGIDDMGDDEYATCSPRRGVRPCSSPVEIRIEHAHLGDAIDRQAVLRRHPAHGLGIRALVDAEGLLSVVADVPVYERDEVHSVCL